MTKPRVTFPDPEAAVVGVYTAAGIADVVSVSFPSQTLTGTAKHLQIELEVGGTEDYPVTERAQVRVTCHMPPGQRTAVKTLASLAQATLYAHSGGNILDATPLVGRSDVITDPTTKNLMVWFTFRVSLKATLLAS